MIQIKSITLKPDPPQPGKNLTIYATGTTKSLISVRSSFPKGFSGSTRELMRDSGGRKAPTRM